ncbi:uncharacterized protein ACJ7VT_000419 isoform 2-T2 [Polymixia lowei]
MSKIEELKVYVNERLQATAVEILGVIEKTITDYEEQASCLKQETDRQRALLDIILRSKLPQTEDNSSTTTTTTTPPIPSDVGLIHSSSGSPYHSNEPQCVFTSRTDFLNFAANGNCPYCSKSTVATEMHLIKRHYLFAIHFIDNGIGKFIVPCTCQERIKGRSHWHCPNCGKTIYRKSNFEVHLSKQHGHLLQQQSQDIEIYQPSMSFCEDEIPPEQWCWPEFSSLGQEEQQPSPPLQIKEEQEELWISLEGRQSQVHPEWQCLRAQDEPEERNEPCNGPAGEQLQGLEGGNAEKNSVFTITHVESLNQDSTPTSQLNSVKSGIQAASTSWIRPRESRSDGDASGALGPASDSQHPAPDCTVAEGGDNGRNGDWGETSEPQSGSKKLRSKKAKAVRRHCSNMDLKRRKPIQLSSSQSPAGPYCCKACGKAFHYMYTLRKHAQTHAPDKSHLCEVCGKHLESTERLLQHLQTHIERNKCQDCGKCFSRNSSLKLHRKVHRGEDLEAVSLGDVGETQ